MLSIRLQKKINFVALAIMLFFFALQNICLAGVLKTLMMSDQIPAELGLGAGTLVPDAPAISNSGDIVYEATFIPDAEGSARVPMIITDNGSSKQIIAKAGDSVLVNGLTDTFTHFEMPEINQYGAMVFKGYADGANGLWKADTAGALENVAYSGTSAPDSGLNFSTFQEEHIHIAGTGDVAFLAKLTDPILSGIEEDSIWSTANGMHRVYGEGDPINGMPAGSEASVFAQSMSFNENGRTKFVSVLSGPGINSGNNRAVLQEAGGQIAVQWHHWTPTLGVSELFTVESPQYAAWNRSGDTLLISKLGGVDNGLIFLDTDGVSRKVWEHQDPAPGTPWGDAKFSTYVVMNAINEAGDAAFLTPAYSPSQGQGGHGIWVDSDGAKRLVAMSGMAAPGIPGVVFSDDIASFIPGSVPSAAHGLHLFAYSMSFSDSGFVAFHAKLSGPGVDYTNGTGIWAEDAEKNLTLIARSGDTITVSPGDERIIAHLDLVGKESGRNRVRNSSFNSQGQLAFRAIFTDNTTGVFLYDFAIVPEPTSLLLITIGLLSVSSRYRRAAKR